MASSVISPVSAANPPSSAAFGQRATEVFERELGRRAGDEPLGAELVEEVAESQLEKLARRIDKDVALWREPREEIHLVDECDVLDDHGVGLHHRLARADDLVVDATEGDDGRTGPLGAEAGEGLGVAVLVKGRDRKDLSRRHDTLSAPAMNAYLKHSSPDLSIKIALI